ncbi:MAG: hypothetical protein CL910_10285 [Deltaproteobacteria bacterium]|jgi:hypothetical protein|nr:hypothetical protein [Deltaproteobacteria bacterium]
MRPRRSALPAVLLAAVAFGLSSPALAVPITVQVDAIASGTFGGTSFTDAAVTFVATGDTDDIDDFGTAHRIINLSMSLTVAGLGSAVFTNATHSIVNHGTDRAGLADIDDNAGLMFVDDPIFDTYALDTSVGPIVGPVTFSTGFDFDTSGGPFEILGVLGGTATFTATVPEPGTLVILLGAFAAFGRRAPLDAGARSEP